MDLKKSLENIRQNQARMLDEMNTLLNQSEELDMLEELKNLRHESTVLKYKYEKSLEAIKKLKNEKEKLKITLLEQMMNEKTAFINRLNERLDIYFQDKLHSGKERLTGFEDKCKDQIRQIDAELDESMIAEGESIKKELRRLLDKVEASAEKMRKEHHRKMEDTYTAYHEKTQTIGEETIDEETVKKKIKHNRLEMNLGTNWLTRIAMVLILLGVAGVIGLTYQHINDIVKAVFVTVLGLAFIVLGEVFHQKKNKSFTAAFIGGGCGILYGAAFYCHFIIDIIGLDMALGYCVAVTVIAIFAALRYNSKWIINLSLIGGYIPLLLFGISNLGIAQPQEIYTGMGYVVILNAIVAAAAFAKRWTNTQMLSLVINSIATFVLAIVSPNLLIGILFAVISFILHLISIIGYHFKNKVQLRDIDIFAVGAATTITSVLLYSLFLKWDLNNYLGLVSLIMGIIFAGLGYAVYTLLPKDKKLRILLFATAVTFEILTIPFQFGIAWVSIGWIIEALVLMYAGYRWKTDSIEKAGKVLFVLSLLVFYLYTVIQPGFYTTVMSIRFIINFAIITAALIATALFYGKNKYTGLMKKTHTNWRRALIYTAIINTFIFLTYLICRFVIIAFNALDLYVFVFGGILFIYLYGYLIKKYLGQEGTFPNQGGSFLMGVSSLIGLFTLLLFPYSSMTPSLPIIPILYAIFLLWGIKQYCREYFTTKSRNSEHYPLTFGIILIILATIFGIIQRIPHLSMALNFLYIILALAFIIYGFKFSYTYIRYLGIGLVLLTLAKYFVFDLYNLEPILKVAALFGFGILLLLISFVYNKVKAKSAENNPA